MTKRIFDFTEFEKDADSFKSYQKTDIRAIKTACRLFEGYGAEIIAVYVDKRSVDEMGGHMNNSYFVMQLPEDPCQQTNLFYTLLEQFCEKNGYPRCEHTHYSEFLNAKKCRVCRKVNHGTKWVEPDSDVAEYRVNIDFDDDKIFVTVVFV